MDLIRNAYSKIEQRNELLNKVPQITMGGLLSVLWSIYPFQKLMSTES